MNPTSLFRNAASSRSFSRKGLRPSSVTTPDVGGSSAPRMYSSVLLPLPEGPIMEAASPRLSESETPERIGMPPRGEGYSLMRLIASSKQTSYDYDTVDPNEKYHCSLHWRWPRDSR